MRVGEGVARGVARRVSAFGSFGGLTPTKPRFLYFRSVAVPDIRKNHLRGLLREATREGVPPDGGAVHELVDMTSPVEEEIYVRTRVEPVGRVEGDEGDLLANAHSSHVQTQFKLTSPYRAQRLRPFQSSDPTTPGDFSFSETALHCSNIKKGSHPHR